MSRSKASAFLRTGILESKDTLAGLLRRALAHLTPRQGKKLTHRSRVLTCRVTFLQLKGAAI